MKIKKYLTLMLLSAIILGVFNNMISFVTYPLYLEGGSQTRSPIFYILMTFALSLFHSSFLVGLYILLRDKIPGKGVVKGLFYGVCLVWLLGPIFALSFEFAYNLAIQSLTIVFAITSLVSWTVYGLILELLYVKIYT